MTETNITVQLDYFYFLVNDIGTYNVIIRFSKQYVMFRHRDMENFTIKSWMRTDVIGGRSDDRLKTTAQRITSNYFGPTEITALYVAPDFTGGIVLRIRRYTGEFERASNLGASKNIAVKKKTA